MNKVAIVIPFYNGDDFILRCLESIKESYQTDVTDLTVYVIDNNIEPSECVEQIQSFEFVEYKKVKSQIGFGRACNIGAHYALKAENDFLIFLNQDTYIFDCLIEELVSVLLSTTKSTIVSPVIFDYENDQIQMEAVKYFMTENNAYFTDSYNGNLKRTYKLPCIGAVCIGMKKETIQKIGLFDPNYFMYEEDMDFMKRNEEYEGELLLVTTAKLAHFLSHNTLSVEKQKEIFVNIEQSRLITQSRIRSRFKLYIYYFRVIIACLRKYEEKVMFRFIKSTYRILLNPAKYKTETVVQIKKRIQMQIKLDLILS